MVRGTRPGASSASARLSPARGDAGRRRRELSQNYLSGPEAARQFLRAVRLNPDGICVEVGAGEGILTTRLAAMSRQVIAYEIDQNMAGPYRPGTRFTYLQNAVWRGVNLEVVMGDARLSLERETAPRMPR